MPSLLSITSHFFLQIAVILLTYRLLWPLFRRLAQVQVVAIMVAGFLLGPSVLGWIWPAAQKWLFPTKLTIGAETFTHPNLTAIYVVGQLGLVLYMFLVGASFQLDIFSAHIRQAGVTAGAGIGVPLALGGVLGWWMVSEGGYFTGKVVHWQGGLFVAAAVAIPLRALLRLTQLACREPRSALASPAVSGQAGILSRRAQKLGSSEQSGAIEAGRSMWAPAPAALALAAMLLIWIPIDVAASARSVWAPWPAWSAHAVQAIGIPARDYEIDAHRLKAYEHGRESRR